MHIIFYCELIELFSQASHLLHDRNEVLGRARPTFLLGENYISTRYYVIIGKSRCVYFPSYP
jgi:hypothetical protein